MDIFKKWLNKPIVKACIMGGMTVFIGIVASIIGLIPQELRTLSFILLIILFIIYVMLLAFYNTSEINYVTKCEFLERRNQAFESEMISLISLFQQSSRNANKLIHEIVDKGKVNLNSWNFDMASTLVCEKIYNTLCKLDENSIDFEVGYIKLDESESNNNIIYMNAYFSRSLTPPTVLLKKRDITEPNGYHDAQLFLNNKADIEILMSEEEIQSVFSYRSATSRANRKKYSQYIGIPVMCASDKGNKMVGLLEITCLNGNKLSTDEVVIREMAEKFFMPYAQLLLLLHKLEKALLAVPGGPKG